MKESARHIVELPNVALGTVLHDALEQWSISDKWETFWARLGKIGSHRYRPRSASAICSHCCKPVATVKVMFTGGHVTGECRDRLLPPWLRRYYAKNRRRNLP